LVVVPLQIEVDIGVAIATGIGFTVTCAVLDIPGHPLAIG